MARTSTSMPRSNAGTTSRASVNFIQINGNVLFDFSSSTKRKQIEFFFLFVKCFFYQQSRILLFAWLELAILWIVFSKHLIRPKHGLYSTDDRHNHCQTRLYDRTIEILFSFFFELVKIDIRHFCYSLFERKFRRILLLILFRLMFVEDYWLSYSFRLISIHLSTNNRIISVEEFDLKQDLGRF